MRVEQCWHTVKGGLRTRPIFHGTPHRICAHVSLCVLALLVGTHLLQSLAAGSRISRRIQLDNKQ
jgi:hypothetical protein